MVPEKEELHVIKIKEEENGITNAFSCEGGKHMGVTTHYQRKVKDFILSEGRKKKMVDKPSWMGST